MFGADAVQLAPSLSFSWGSSSGPAGLMGRTDFFAARFAAHLRVDSPGNYTFQLSSDDDSRLYVNGRFAGGRGLVPVALERGYALLTVHYLEITGAAHVSLSWDAGRQQVGRALRLGRLRHDSCGRCLQRRRWP